MQPLIIRILLGDSTPWHTAIPKSMCYTYCTNHSTTDLLPVIPDWGKNKYLSQKWNLVKHHYLLCYTQQPVNLKSTILTACCISWI